jgi:hypothetical protein
VSNLVEDKLKEIIKRAEEVTNYQEKIKLVNNAPFVIFKLIRLNKSSPVLESNAAFADSTIEGLFKLNELNSIQFLKLLSDFGNISGDTFKTIVDTNDLKAYLNISETEEIGSYLVDLFLVVYQLLQYLKL